MKFSELPLDCYFVVIEPDKEMPLLAKDCNGGVRKAQDWLPFSDSTVAGGTEVQPVYFKKPSCEK